MEHYFFCAADFFTPEEIQNHWNLIQPLNSVLFFLNLPVFFVVLYKTLCISRQLFFFLKTIVVFASLFTAVVCCLYYSFDYMNECMCFIRIFFGNDGCFFPFGFYFDFSVLYGLTGLHFCIFFSFVVSQETHLPSAPWFSTTHPNPDIGIREKYLNSNPASQGTQLNSPRHFSKIVFHCISHAANVNCSDRLEVARSGHNDGLLCSTRCTATRGIVFVLGGGPYFVNSPSRSLF